MFSVRYTYQPYKKAAALEVHLARLANAWAEVSRQLLAG